MTKLSKFILVLATFFSSAESYAAADHYEFDKAHSHIIFLVNHLGFSNMLGMFSDYNGTFQFDPKTPDSSLVDITLHPSGIHTTSELLDHVLQGENFFNTSKFPDIHFISKSVKVTGDHTGDLTGDLTMLGVTKHLTLHVTFNKADYQPVTNLFVAGFSAEATLKRSDYGMTYAIPMVGDEVRVQIEVEGIDSDRKDADKIKH